MKIIWIISLLLIQSYYTTIGSQLQEEYNQYSFYQKKPLSPRPLDVMADLTNDLGVCVLQVIAAGGTVGNIAFSPFGLMAVSVLLYEGSSGYSALQIKQSLNLPWEILAVRIGVRDLNRHLKTYFKSDGFLNGLTMSREEVCLRTQFKRVLRLYGFDDPNSFLVDSCSESATKTTTQPIEPMSVTTHGTVVTEITPTSQIVQVSTNITNVSSSTISTLTTEIPARVTLVGDATMTISNIDTNTNLPMNSQTDTMIVDIEIQPNIRPIESSTNQVETTVLTIEQEPKVFNENEITDIKINSLILTEPTIIASTPPNITSNDSVVTTTVKQISMDYNSGKINSDSNKMIDTTPYSESHATLTETSTTLLSESTTNDTLSGIDMHAANNETILPVNLFVMSTKNNRDTTVAFTERTLKTTIDTVINESNVMKDLTESTTEAIIMTSTNNEVSTDINETTIKSMVTDNTVEIISSTKAMTNEDGSTAAYETNTISEALIDQKTTYVKFKLNSYLKTVSENIIPTTEVPSTIMQNSSNSAENDFIKEAESNQYYQIASLEKKSPRSMESNENLPTFNVEFVVRKEDLRNDCNQTRKITIIKPDRILTEYPKNSLISIKLRDSKKRRRKHLEQDQGYNTNRFNGYNNYEPPFASWMDRSSTGFEFTNFFNAGYRRIPFFTYTAVLPFGFIFELKSQVIEIPLDDPKYTLMIIMPNHPEGLSELLLMLSTMSLRNIHNSLKPTAVHATIPTFKYTAKVDLTSAIQQIGIQDVFYTYRADLSFMSSDTRLFVSSVQQVVSVTVKKYNMPPVYEIQRKYVEHDFVVSRPFIYFVLDIHTKVSLIAGIITDPLASPIWI